MTNKITFNGKEYSSVDEMPPDVRQAYEKVIQVFQDKDHDGVPDIFQGSAQNTQDAQRIVINQSSFTKIIFNGKEYSSVDEMPPNVRQAYEQAMSAFADQNKNGVPDVFESSGNAVVQVSKQFSVERNLSPALGQSVSTNVTTSDTNLFLVGILVAILLVIVAVLLFLLLFTPRVFR